MNESKNVLRPLAEELKGYGHFTELVVVDRDGDLYYIECPECHRVELRRRSFFSCSSCMTSFGIHSEDGIRHFPMISEMGMSQAEGEIIVVQPGDYFWHPIYGRNKNRIGELGKVDRETLRRDLQKGGMDAHGHSRYRRVAIVPLD